MSDAREVRGRVVRARRAAVEAVLRATPEEQLLEWDGDWDQWRNEGQAPPAGDWRVWVMLAGRGFGKTRTGAEWVKTLAEGGGDLRIALVAASLEEARRVMVEGRSGLLSLCPNAEWEPSRGRLRFASGAEAFVYSGGQAEALRGPEHHFAWCDELAKWPRLTAAWDNLMLGLRLGEAPRVLATTTPRSIEALKRIMGAVGTVVTRGRTADNPHLPDAFIAAVSAAYGGTALGRQELDGELIEQVEGALWTREVIERCRVSSFDRVPSSTLIPSPAPPLKGGDSCAPTYGASPPSQGGVRGGSTLRRVVVGVDPPASAGAGADACGIVVCGVDDDGRGLVLADRSVQGVSPDRWARAVAAAADEFGATKVVVEGNVGQALVENVLRAADAGLPLHVVHAAKSKAARAEPVAALYTAGKVLHVGSFPALEDEMCGLLACGGYEGPGRSPDRADALVWALTELMLGKVRSVPRAWVG